MNNANCGITSHSVSRNDQRQKIAYYRITLVIRYVNNHSSTDYCRFSLDIYPSMGACDVSILYVDSCYSPSIWSVLILIFQSLTLYMSSLTVIEACPKTRQPGFMRILADINILSIILVHNHIPEIYILNPHSHTPHLLQLDYPTLAPLRDPRSSYHPYPPHPASRGQTYLSS